MSTAEKVYLSPKEFADRIGISRSLAYVLLKEERIPGAFRVGQKGRAGKYLIPAESVEKFVASCRDE